MEKPKPGTIVWTDLTVPDAGNIRDFYAQVAGWKPRGVSMGDYEDYEMTISDGGAGVAGVCFKRGSNANLPAYWLVYVAVENLDDSIKACLELGGKVIDGPRPMGKNKFCVIQDPAGAFAGLIE